MGFLLDLPLPPDVALFVTGAVGVLMRLSLLVFILPGIGELAIPIRVRMAVVMALTAAIVPSVVPQQLESVAATDVLALLAFEALIGFALGFSFRVLIYALMAAGTIISQSMSLSQIFGASALTEPNPTVSVLLALAGAAIFLTLDLHAAAVGLMAESYLLFPLGDVPDTGALAEWATTRTTGAFALAVSLALPFLLINFLYNVILGLINQAMPQMMVTFIGVPANVMAGIVVLAIAVGAILTVWRDRVELAFQGFW